MLLALLADKNSHSDVASSAQNPKALLGAVAGSFTHLATQAHTNLGVKIS